MKTTLLTREPSKKELIIEKILKEPQHIKQKDIELLIKGDADNSALTHEELRKIFLRIFDINDKKDLGSAHTGPLGFLNKKSQEKRNKIFFKKIKKNPRLKKIVVEGDSWFEHPLIKDTFDWLSKRLKKDYALYSLAHGGDWLLNIIRDGKYISELPIIKPEILMLSGGGNDLVDDHRLSMMVEDSQWFYSRLKDSQHKYADIKKLMAKNTHLVASNGISIPSPEEAIQAEEYLKIGMRYLSKDFWSILWGLELSFKFIICQIRQKYPNLRIIILGYDYAIPSFSAGPGILQWVLNKFLKNGHWLKEALLIAGIQDEKHQRAIIFSFIYLFNLTIAEISNSEEYGREVFHLDGRGIAKSKADWLDELHLKGKGFRTLADRAIALINKEQEKASQTKVHHS